MLSQLRGSLLMAIALIIAGMVLTGATLAEQPEQRESAPRFTLPEDLPWCPEYNEPVDLSQIPPPTEDDLYADAKCKLRTTINPAKFDNEGMPIGMSRSPILRDDEFYEFLVDRAIETNNYEGASPQSGHGEYAWAVNVLSCGYASYPCDANSPGIHTFYTNFSPQIRYWS